MNSSLFCSHYLALRTQTMIAIRQLYHCANLVHAALSAYNILVLPMQFVENVLDKSDEAKDSLQIVLIDFAQSIEVKHPSSKELLPTRDLSMVRIFFNKQGLVTLNLDNSEYFIMVKEID